MNNINFSLQSTAQSNTAVEKKKKFNFCKSGITGNCLFNKLSYLYYRKRSEKSLENMHTDTRVLKRLNSWELLSLIKVMFKYKLSNIFVTSHFLLKENLNMHSQGCQK